MIWFDDAHTRVPLDGVVTILHSHSQWGVLNNGTLDRNRAHYICCERNKFQEPLFRPMMANQSRGCSACQQRVLTCEVVDGLHAAHSIGVPTKHVLPLLSRLAFVQAHHKQCLVLTPAQVQ